MRRLILAVTAIVMLTANGPEQRRTYSLPGDIRGQTILYVGGHPDDEWGFAPILAEACVERGAKCRFLVAADANSGGCLITIGLRDFKECSTRRRVEMQHAAALFGGTVEFLGFDDLFYAFNERGLSRTLSEWASSAGGNEALVRRFEDAIRRARPRLLFTFDPRHGSSCHVGHRAAATLAIEAVKRMPKNERPEIWLEQTSELEEHGEEAAAAVASGGYFAWPETSREAYWYDANRLFSNGRTAFEYVIENRKKHATQMPDEASGKRILNPPHTARWVPISPLSVGESADFCTPLNLKRPTLDTPEGQALLQHLMRDEKKP